MEKSGKKNRWSVEQRLEFIDFRLFWEGRVNRSDLVGHFGVSVPQASADLTLYQEEAPGNALYDKTLKTYVAGPAFKAKYFEPSADSYLAQFRLIEAGLLSGEEAWAIRSTDVSIVPPLRRRIGAATLRAILEAIRARSQLRIIYQSMSDTDAKSRWIAPHAIAFDGFRWHARAWCFNRARFSDFVLARVLAVGETTSCEISSSGDLAWHRRVTLRFAPHPDLRDGKRKAIELDYGMTNGIAEISTRVCLSYYLERNFGFDSESPQAKAERHQIVLINRDELEAARTEVNESVGGSAGSPG